ncbi:hypothetical protein [Nonomuraea sp. NPDC049625]|uniref:hypothetical protein n=1 Tax=Nonomuraea sp. NPDC049625 TaxID=3155775 RepID=UPI00344386E9
MSDGLLRWVPSLSRRKRGAVASAPTSADVATAKDILTGLVTEKWREETALRSLGGPGAGKTTRAVQLAFELLNTRQPKEPVPVLVSAARWDDRVHPRPQDWLADSLAAAYPALCAASLGPDVPETLLARGEVLPVIHGLDELPGTARADMLTELNRSMCEADQLIPALVSTRVPAGNPPQPFRPQHTWTPEQVGRWLTYLSRQLAHSEEDPRDVAWWHLARHMPSLPIRAAIPLRSPWTSWARRPKRASAMPGSSSTSWEGAGGISTRSACSATPLAASPPLRPCWTISGSTRV